MAKKKRRKVSFSFTAEPEYGYLLRYLGKKLKVNRSRLFRLVLAEFVKNHIDTEAFSKHKFLSRWVERVIIDNKFFFKGKERG